MQKVIRDSWNNYMSRRRLDNFWVAFQAAIANDTMTNAQKDEALANFHQCFLSMAKEAMEEQQGTIDSNQAHQQAHQETIKKNKQNKGTNPETSLQQDQPPKDNLSFFTSKDQYLATICSYLQSKTRTSEEWSVWQTTHLNLIDTLESIQVFLQDGLDMRLEMNETFESVMLTIVYQLSHATSAAVVKQFLNLLHIIFHYDNMQIINFAKKDRFSCLLTLLDCDHQANASDIVIKYMAKWLQVEMENFDDDSEDESNRRPFEAKDFKDSYISGIIHKIQNKLIGDLNKDFVEEADESMPFEHTKQNNNIGDSNQSNLQVNTRDSDQLLQKSSSEMTYRVESQVRKLLREGKFLKEVTQRFRESSEANLVNYTQVLKILNVFASINFVQAQEQTSIFDAVCERFKTGSDQMHLVYDLLIQIVSYQSSVKVKNQHFWELLFQLIETMIEGAKEVQNETHEKLTVSSINSLRKALSKQSPLVAALFVNQKGCQRMKQLIIQAATKEGDSCTLGPLLDLTMVLLFQQRAENRSHQFAIDMAELLLTERLNLSISASNSKQLFHFLRLIIKDKIEQVKALDQQNTDTVIDIEEEIDGIIDKHFKQFLKGTFRLYFDFNADENLRIDSQMLLLCALDLQDKVNQVAQLHEIPQIIILFKETEEDTEMEAINFLETLQDLIEQRDAHHFQDILNGFLAAKMTIVFQDTCFLSLQDIKSLIDSLLKEPSSLALDMLMQPDRVNPFFATVFSPTQNCRASQLQDFILACQKDILEGLCSSLESAIQTNDQTRVVQNLHRLVLMSQNSIKFKKAIEKIFDFKQIVKELQIRLFDVEAQLFILQCMLEMQADKIIYEDSIMSLEAILLHQSMQISGDEEDYLRFKNLLKKVSKNETLRDNSFNDLDQVPENSLNPDYITLLQNQSNEFVRDTDEVQDEGAKPSSRFSSGVLRENSYGFTLFLLTLTQTSRRVQLQVLEDLSMLAMQSLRNVRVMVQQNTQVYLLHMLKLDKDRNSSNSSLRLNSSHSQELTSLLQILISYGVCIPKGSEQDLLVECLGSRRKLNNEFVDSVVECLLTSFSQVVGYVHFLDAHTASNALQINGGAIGVSSWLLTPELNPETLQAILLTINLGQSMMIKVELVLDLVQRQTPVDFNIDDETLGNESEDIREFDNSQSETYDKLSSAEYFYLQVSLVKQRTDRKTEVLSLHKVTLENMIHLSLFHLHGFNHYVTQVNDKSGFDIYINSHQMGAGLFQKELSEQTTFLQSLDFAAQATVANLSLIHSCLRDLDEVEKLRNADFTVKQNELMGLTQLNYVSSESFYLTMYKEGQGSQKNNSQQIDQSAVSANENSEIAFTLQVPTSPLQSEDLFQEMSMQIEKHSIKIPVVTNLANIEVFQDSDSIMTLKRYLSTQHAIKAIFELLEFASDDLSTLKCLRLLACIIIQNKNIKQKSEGMACQEDIMVIFDRVNGYSRLESILAQKLPELKLAQVKQLFTLLIEISCDELNCSLRIDDKISQQKGIRSPILYQNRIGFLKMGLSLVKSSPVDQSIQFLEMLQNLLKQDKNLEIFRQHIGFDSILSLFRMIEQNQRFRGLYDSTLSLFELFICAICRSDEKVLTQQERKELTLIFEFLLSRDLEQKLRFIKLSQQATTTRGLTNQNAASIQNLLVSKQKQCELVSQALIDCLSIISIHILVEVSQKPGAKSVLLNKIFLSVDLSDFIFSLLQSQFCSTNQAQPTSAASTAKDEPIAEVRMYALKFLQMLMYLSEDFKKQFFKKGGYDTLTDFLVQKEQLSNADEGSNQTKPFWHLSELESMEASIISKIPYLQGRRSQNYTASKGNFNLNMIMLDAATCRFDNVYVMFSEKQTFVHTVLNRSRIAESIVAQVKVSLKKPKRVKIVYFGIIKTFLKSLAYLDNDISRQICLKHLHWLLVENEVNLTALLEDSAILRQFIEHIFQYELDVIQREGWQKNSTSDTFTSNTGKRLFDLIQNHSPNEELTPSIAAQHNSATRNERRNPIKSLEVAQQIIKDILVRDLDRPPHQSQTFKLLEEFPDTDSVFQYQVIMCLIRHFQRNSKVSERNVIQNLQKILANLDRFLGEDMYVSMKAINLINTLALKASNKFRDHLKSLKLIELRDKLLQDQIRKTYSYLCQCVDDGEEPKEEFINAICCLFSYGQLAPKAIFVENFGVEYLTLVLLIVGEIEKTSQSQQAKFANYFTHLQTRIKEEVMQFAQNDTSPELRAYFQGQGDAAFFSRLRDYLSQRVSPHLESSRQGLESVQEEAMLLRKQKLFSKVQAAQVNSEISKKVQAKLQKEFQNIFDKAKTVIFSQK